MTETTNTLVTLDDVRRNAEVAVLVRKADHNLEVLGYTEHAERHATIVATTAATATHRVRTGPAQAAPG